MSDPTAPTDPAGHGSSSEGTGAPGGTEVWERPDGTQVTVGRISQVRTLSLGGGRSNGKGKQVAAAVLLGVVFVGAMFTLITLMAIWPGEAKLTAGLLCPADRQEVFIVTDTVQSSEGGTATDYTMYCVGERGDTTEVHFLKPFAVLWAAHTVALLLVVVAWTLISPGRRRRRAERRNPSIPGAGPEADFEPPGPIIS